MRFANDSAFSDAFSQVSDQNRALMSGLASQAVRGAGRKKAAEELLRAGGGGGMGFGNAFDLGAKALNAIGPGLFKGGSGWLSRTGGLGDRVFSSGFDGGGDLVSRAFSGLDLGF
jgi:hypothetical protein